MLLSCALSSWEAFSPVKWYKRSKSYPPESPLWQGCWQIKTPITSSRASMLWGCGYRGLWSWLFCCPEWPESPRWCIDSVVHVSIFRCAVASLQEGVSVRLSVCPSVRPVLFSKVKRTHTRRILCRVSGLVTCQFTVKRDDGIAQCPPWAASNCLVKIHRPVCVWISFVSKHVETLRLVTCTTFFTSYKRYS